MSFKKCNLLYIGRTIFKPNLLLNNICVAVLEKVRDIGVIIDSHLTFHTHIKQTVGIGAEQPYLSMQQCI